MHFSLLLKYNLVKHLRTKLHLNTKMRDMFVKKYDSENLRVIF